MIELTAWFGREPLLAKPWLVLGKGPTFDRRDQFDLGAYNLLALNHAVDELAVDVAHIIDINVVADCTEALARNCEWLLMPRVPHRHSLPGDRRLEDWFDELPVLRELDDRGRLVWYNGLHAVPEPGSPVIDTGTFSSEAVLRILGRMGVSTVRSLGIDGGRSYARAFAHLEETTLLENAAPGYDVQLGSLAAIAAQYGIDYRPLVTPLRIFVGTDDTQLLAFRVLEYSIRKSSSVPVEVVPLFDTEHRMPRDPQNRPRTRFSFSRFVIPELCGYEGRALYLDADMLVFGDVAELHDLPFDGAKILTSAPARTEAWDAHDTAYLGVRSVAVMLLDCAQLPWKVDDIVAGLDEGRYTYQQLMSDVCVVEPDEIVDAIPPEWNDLERYTPGRTKLLHFTVVPTQPWKNDDNPLTDVWTAWYREAVAGGAVPPTEVEELIDAGLAKPSLRPALSLAPSRRTVLTGASLDLITARRRIGELEGELAAVRVSTSWRVGSAVVRSLRAPAEAVRRAWGARRGVQR